MNHDAAKCGRCGSVPNANAHSDACDGRCGKGESKPENSATRTTSDPYGPERDNVHRALDAWIDQRVMDVDTFDSAQLRAAEKELFAGFEFALLEAYMRCVRTPADLKPIGSLTNTVAHKITDVSLGASLISVTAAYVSRCVALATARVDILRLTRERDLAIAHDRQPYPTQWAYDQACVTLETVRAENRRLQTDLAHAQERAVAEHAARRITPEVRRQLVDALANWLGRGIFDRTATMPKDFADRIIEMLGCTAS